MGVSMFGEFDALAANNEGNRLLELGLVDEGLALLAASAEGGAPWALATYSWQQLISGNPAEALRLADAALPACHAWIASLWGQEGLANEARYQVVNSQSNLALCGLALGQDPTDALAVWDEGVLVGHSESAFYPAIVAYREGDVAAARARASAVPQPVLAGLRATFLKNSLTSSTWFASWCADGLAVLDLIGFQAPSVTHLDLDRMRALPRLRDSADMSDDDWEALGLVHQGDQEMTGRALRRLADAGGAPSYPARMELGTLLIDTEHFLSPGFRQGWDLLTVSLEAPFKDVAGAAAWNMATEFRRQGDEESAEAFGRLALELGDQTALSFYVDQARDAGDLQAASELVARAGEVGSDSPAATAVSAVEALNAAAHQDAPIRDWFAAAQGSLPAQTLADVTPIYAWRGDYNVDVASAAIASDYFGECDLSCYFDSTPGSCDNCGRTSDRFLYVASGAGDGGYSAFELYGQSGEVLGVMTTFMDVMVGAPFVGAVADFRTFLDSSAPLHMGRIDTQGRLIFADAAMTSGDRNVSVDVEVPPGSYEVVCWVGAGPSGDELLPVAFAACGGALGAVLAQHCAPMAMAERDRIISSLWGAPNRTVFALAVDIREQVLANNVEMLREADPTRALSYALQWAERDNAEDSRAFVADHFECGSQEALEALDSRGWYEPNLPWWQPEMVSDPRDVWLRVVAAREPGLTPSSDACEDIVWVRRAVASHPLLTADQAAILARDVDRQVRINLARNPATPSNMLDDLTMAAEPEVASAAAANEGCPAEALARLARAGRCLHAVASNPRSPIEIQESPPAADAFGTPATSGGLGGPSGGGGPRGGSLHSFCYACGAALVPGGRFCPGCGTAVLGADGP